MLNTQDIMAQEQQTEQLEELDTSDDTSNGCDTCQKGYRQVEKNCLRLFASNKSWFYMGGKVVCSESTSNECKIEKCD